MKGPPFHRPAAPRPLGRPLWLAVGVLLGGAGSARGQVPLDRHYPAHRTRQEAQLVSRVRRILSPTLSFPALAASGGRFSVLIQLKRDPAGQLLMPDRLAQWMVFVTSAEGEATRCPVVAAKKEGDQAWIDVGVPHHLARDLYDLRIVAPGIDDSQPCAVRVHRRRDSARFRFVVMSDHQLWDPSFIKGRALNAKAFPARGKQRNISITRQGLLEARLLDPQFVLYTGDLLFGVDYPREYREMRRLLRSARLPIFAVPGNHDGYAVYNVRLRGNPVAVAAGAIRCRRELRGEISWSKAWRYISCVYGDVKHHLFTRLRYDGLTYWRRTLGPTDYSFDHGSFTFIGINSYAGTPERRHAFAIYMDAFDLHLGAPAVDNYGGYLGAEQLRYVDRQMADARRRGRVPVVFTHHDPRGNPSGTRYHPNEPFPTDPLGMGQFEEWNFDSRQWDSDAHDRRRDETARRNSAVRLLAILAKHGGYLICGHVHRDSRRVYRVGERLGPHRVKRRLEVIRTTSAASSTKGDGYWGYRLIEARDGRLAGVDFSPRHKLGSVPAGNFWAAPVKGAALPELELHAGLPRPLAITIRWPLAPRPQGYRFRLRGAPGSGRTLAGAEQPRVREVSFGAKKTVYYLTATLPAAGWPPGAGRGAKLLLRAVEARDNRPPEAVIEAAVADGLDLQPLTPEFDAAPGQALLLSAERSRDPEGDRIVDYLWHLGPGKGARGERVVHRFASAGAWTVRLTLVDEAGARTTVERVLHVRPPRPPVSSADGCRGCCSAREITATGASALLALTLLLVVYYRRKARARQERR